MNMNPLRDNIFINPDEATAQTQSGLLLHEAWKSLPQTGVIAAVGPDVEDLRVGQRVVFLRYAVQDVDVDGTRLKYCKPKHIVATYAKED